MFQTWICTKIRVDIRYPVRFLLEVAKVNMVQLSWGVSIFLVKELHHLFRWNSRIKRRKSSIHPGSLFFSHVDIQSDYEFFQQRVFWLRTYFMLICRLWSRFGAWGVICVEYQNGFKIQAPDEAFQLRSFLIFQTSQIFQGITLAHLSSSTKEKNLDPASPLGNFMLLS